MKHLLIAGLTALSLTFHPPGAFAHGGQYRGPGDTVPPNSGGGRPGTPGPSTPDGPSGPGTGGPSGPRTPSGGGGPITGGPNGGSPGPTRGPRTPGGISLEPDLTQWQFWWELNNAPFLELRKKLREGGPLTHPDDYFIGRTIRTGRRDTLLPTEAEIRSKVVPRLKRALEETRNRDIVTACLIALAKIGLEEDTVIPLIERHLAEKDQEVAESAVLALGILSRPAAAAKLIAIVRDGEEGRARTGRPHGIGIRTRSFAAYALGLIAYANADLDLKERIFKALLEVLRDERMSQRDLRIAAIQGIRLLRVSPGEGERAEALHARALRELMSFYDRRDEIERQAQAHVPTAVATLVGRELDRGGELAKRFLRDLREPRTSPWVRQSCALALGHIARRDDAEVSSVLMEEGRSGKDQQTRCFALVSLGRIGGEQNRNYLMGRVRDARKIDKGWAALALGVLCFEARGAEAGGGSGPDLGAGRLLHEQLLSNANPDVQAGLCVALGLVHHVAAAEDVATLLREKSSDESLAGYACVSLGLLNHVRAREQIRALAEGSTRRQDRLRQAALGLALLGDKTVAGTLVGLLREKGTSLAAQAAIASALGLIGDRTSLDALGEMLFDERVTSLARAFAAAALGSIADKEDHPWNSKIAIGLNYRANTETLTDGAAGVLDIL